MHYVPFTYAGTVDAYKRTGVSDKNTDAYEHSLFIVDYNVTHTVSWNDLNAQGMIFGKTYTSGGIDYTLRAPSVGRTSMGGAETKRVLRSIMSGTPFLTKQNRTVLTIQAATSRIGRTYIALDRKDTLT